MKQKGRYQTYVVTTYLIGGQGGKGCASIAIWFHRRHLRKLNLCGTFIKFEDNMLLLLIIIIITRHVIFVCDFGNPVRTNMVHGNVVI